MYNSYSKPFMSCASFIDCFFMWAANFNLEFRNEIDHVCGHHPHVCDGTRLGIQLKNLNITTINQSQLSKTVSSLHIRSDRVLFLIQMMCVINGFDKRDLIY